MNGLIDIHSHILPLVDDGAESVEMALLMLKKAAEEEIEKIILTPHQKPDRRCVTPEGILRRMEELRELAGKEKIPVQLYPGNEIFYRHGLAELLDKGKIRTMADSRYVLIEFLPGEDYTYIRDALSRVASFGYRPITAHVERYVNVMSRIDKAEELKEDTGCYFQVNAASMTGENGFSVKNMTRKLLKEGLVDFIATDAHRSEGKRSPDMKACAEWVKKKLGEERMEQIFCGNPTALLKDQII